MAGWVSSVIADRWRTVQFILIVVLSSVLISGVAGLNILVSQFLLGSFYYPFAWVSTSVTELRGVAIENRRLQEALVQTSFSLSQMEEIQRENQRLRSVLGFEASPQYSLIPVRVMAIYGDNQPSIAVINRGSSDSIFVDQAVINRQGLVGRIQSSSADFATVQLLSNLSNRVAARLVESREMGIIRYTMSDGLTLANFPIDGDINMGDQIISSGLGGIYPSGIKVGKVVDITRPSEEAFCEIKVQPVVNFHSIEELFVLKSDPQ